MAVKEVEERRSLPPEALKEQEGALLLAALPRGARAVALDEGGRQMDSREFDTLLGRWQDDGTQELALLIGGDDGLSRRSEERRDGKEGVRRCSARGSP